MSIDSSSRMAISVQETAKRLGVSRQTMYTHLRQGRIRSVKLGRKTLIPVTELASFLAGK